jgi:hypothetical protein
MLVTKRHIVRDVVAQFLFGGRTADAAASASTREVDSRAVRVG